MFVKFIIPILAALGIASFFIPFDQGSSLAQSADAAPATALSAPSSGEIHGLGVVEPEAEVFEIHSTQPGVIEEIYVSEGQSVVKDEPLFRVRDINIKEKIASERKYIEWLEQRSRAEWVDYQKADELYERVRKFDDGIVISRDEVLRRKHEKSRLSALLSASKKEIEYRNGLIKELEREAGQLLVTAPTDGQVLYSDLKPGQSARASGRPHLRIAPEGQLAVRLQVNEKDAWRVSERCSALFSIPGHPDPVHGQYLFRELEMRPKSSTNGIHEVVDSRVLEVRYVLKQVSSAQLPLVFGQQISGRVSCPH